MEVTYMKRKSKSTSSSKSTIFSPGILWPLVVVLVLTSLLLVFVNKDQTATTPESNVQGANTGGFDQYGYNNTARVFVGSADGVDRILDGKVWGDPTYANDHLVMKWNAQWDACNAAGNNSVAACLGAWTDNEWNGNVTGGSRTTEHYKIIWVGSEGTSSKYWLAGGYLVWGSYEVIMDQGTFNGSHSWFAHATPNGYGAVK
jgi:hypothetical protein